MFLPYEVASEDAKQLIDKLKRLRKLGWISGYDEDGKIRLLHPEKDNRVYCPVTASCLEFGDQDLPIRATIEAGEKLGFDQSTSLGFAAAADKGATVEGRGGARYCSGWGYSRWLRLKILLALGVLFRRQSIRNLRST